MNDSPLIPFLRKGSTRVEKLKFSRIAETSSTETSANDTDDAAAGGLEDDAAACNNRGHHYTVHNLHRP